MQNTPKQNPTLNLAQNLIVFSLGNPGGEYKHTRHNAGRILCEELERAGFFEKNNIRYLVPDTYMNDTGKYIKEKVRYLSNHKLIIVYDDIDISLGEIKISFGRSSGGHNGVESVINELGTRDFYRLRVGIGGKPIKEMLLQDYVLSKLKEEEVKLIKNSVKRSEELILSIN